MPGVTCRHRDVSDAAVAIDPFTGREATITVHLCCFPDNEPGRFVDAPRWLLKMVGTGIAIDPARDCINCPAYQEKRDGP